MKNKNESKYPHTVYMSTKGKLHSIVIFYFTMFFILGLLFFYMLTLKWQHIIQTRMLLKIHFNNAGSMFGYSIESRKVFIQGCFYALFGLFVTVGICTGIGYVFSKLLA